MSSGGCNKKSLREHIINGTYFISKHGPIPSEMTEALITDGSFKAGRRAIDFRNNKQNERRAKKSLETKEARDEERKKRYNLAIKNKAEWSKEYYQENKKKLAVRRNIWRMNNREKCNKQAREYNKKYAESNREKKRGADNARNRIDPSSAARGYFRRHRAIPTAEMMSTKVLLLRLARETRSLKEARK